MSGQTPNPKFDRVARPQTPRARDRDDAGKEALYSTSPEAPTSGIVNVVCRRCASRSSLSARQAIKLLKPPMVFNPLKISAPIWAKCPACSKRSWLHLEPGDAVKAYLGGEDR